LDQFKDKRSIFRPILLKRHADERVGSLCTCGRARRTTRCETCYQSPLTCSRCFIEAHLNTFTHWGQVYDEERRFFRRYDITSLPDFSFVIQLGHEGGPCPFVSGSTPRNDSREDDGDDDNYHWSDADDEDSDEPLLCVSGPKEPLAVTSLGQAPPPFHINLVDLNGVHGTKVQYCRCSVTWREMKAEQLLEAGFFPATPKNPGTAFSFQLLKHYQNHSPVLYQFAEGLRKDTDSALPSDVPVCSSLIRHVVTSSPIIRTYRLN
jgi:hypothetical protein